MAFSLHRKQVSFLKEAEPGRGHLIPKKFPREAQRTSRSLGSLRCSRCLRSGVSPRKVSDLRPGPGTQPGTRPSPARPDTGPCPLRLQLRLPKPPLSNSRCAGRRGCWWERRCEPQRQQARKGWRPAELVLEPKARITYASASPPRRASAQPAGRVEQELAEVCQAPAEVSGKLQLSLGVSGLAHGGGGRGVEGDYH